MPEKFIASDLVKVYDANKKLIATLFWGDRVDVTGTVDGRTQIRFWAKVVKNGKKEWQLCDGFLPAKAKLEGSTRVLKIRFLDVGQGDGAIVETPKGRIVIIDGGEGDAMVRYASIAYHLSTRNDPLPVDSVVVTHGDTDHYAGLLMLLNKRVGTDKRLAVAPAAILHNGMVKVDDPSTDVEAFGPHVTVNGTSYCTNLVDDVTTFPTATLSPSFRRWQACLQDLQDKGAAQTIKRLEYGDDAAFDFLGDEGVKVKVLGPITEEVSGKPALPFLSAPGGKKPSDSHTINGHSVILKLTYGNVRLLFGADLNEESEERLLQRAKADGISLTSEILKVPHHGSHEFNTSILEAIRPVVSIVSSGDENTAKEYIHPRALLIGALGRYSRQTVDKPLIFVTEMVSFFKKLDKAFTKAKNGSDEAVVNPYSKTQYGIIHVRTDGERVLVVTHSGDDDKKESYAFTVDEHGKVAFEEK